jgi:hypothetical protein
MALQKAELVAGKALAKAQSVEARLNALIGTSQNPNTPSVLYNTGSTTVSQTVNGVYAWTCPAGVTQAEIECWGAGAGGGGGGASQGGEGGGGGEYTQEPAYAVVPGTVYTYAVGAGGTGGTTGNSGGAGGSTLFDTSNFNGIGGVLAAGGSAGAAYTGGPGGSGSGQTVDFPGGSGGGDGAQLTGGCGGGGSGGFTGGGGSGTDSTGTTGTAGGAAGTGGGFSPGAAGGAGGNSGANGSNGASPGGGGGGCGAATASGQVQFAYNPVASGTYFGPDAIGGNANQKRSGVTMYQNGETASGGTYNGTQKSAMLLPSSVASDLSGVTIDKITLSIKNLHTWYSSMTVLLGYAAFGPPPMGPSWGGTPAITSVINFHVTQYSFTVVNLTNTGLGAALKSGAATALTLGPGSSYNLGEYGYFLGAGGGAEEPNLTVNGHTGATPVQAGSGADGQVKITYTVPAAMIAAVQPAAGVDGSGNAFATGYTGPTAALNPTASPAALETWHPITLDGTWALNSSYATPSYRLLPDGNLQLAGLADWGSNATASQAVNSAHPLPSQYRPPTVKVYRGSGYGSNRGGVQIDSTGVITMIATAGQPARYCEIDGIVTLSI